MASDPVFQARLGQCPQDAAVPSCSLSDIFHPLPSDLADQRTQVLEPFWGPKTLGDNRTEAKTYLAYRVVDKC